MGACVSREGSDMKRVDMEIDCVNRRDAEREAQKVKLLLLGAGESGKSTVLKQMRILYGKGYQEQERAALRNAVSENLLTGIKTLIAATQELDLDLQTEPDVASVAAVLDSLPPGSIVDSEIAGHIRTVWSSAIIQKCFEERHKLQMNDSFRYFLSRLNVIADPSYIPNVDDVLNVRVRTSGIVEEKYVIDSVPFTVYDVGGQRNERRKWISCFDEVTAVIFVAALSEYDQVLFEDSSTNRLMEALNLFEEVANMRCFAKTSILVLLNKSDLFKEKIMRVDLRQPNPNPLRADAEPYLFADYTGGCNHDLALQYIIGQFSKRVQNPAKQVFYHCTCATDTSQVSTVLGTVKETILRGMIDMSY